MKTHRGFWQQLHHTKMMKRCAASRTRAQKAEEQTTLLQPAKKKLVMGEASNWGSDLDTQILEGKNPYQRQQSIISAMQNIEHPHFVRMNRDRIE